MHDLKLYKIPSNTHTDKKFHKFADMATLFMLLQYMFEQKQKRLVTANLILYPMCYQDILLCICAYYFKINAQH